MILNTRFSGINNEQKDTIICQLKTTFAQGKAVTHGTFPERCTKFRWNAPPPKLSEFGVFEHHSPVWENFVLPDR